MTVVNATPVVGQLDPVARWAPYAMRAAVTLDPTQTVRPVYWPHPEIGVFGLWAQGESRLTEEGKALGANLRRVLLALRRARSSLRDVGSQLRYTVDNDLRRMFADPAALAQYVAGHQFFNDPPEDHRIPTESVMLRGIEDFALGVFRESVAVIAPADVPVDTNTLGRRTLDGWRRRGGLPYRPAPPHLVHR